MNLISKVLAGIYHFYADGDLKTLSGLNLFIAKLALTAPLVILGVFIVGTISDFMNVESRQFLPNGKLSSFLFFMLFYPTIHFLSASKEELLKFIEQTEEKELKKYYQYFVYILVASGALFVVAVLIVK